MKAKMRFVQLVYFKPRPPKYFGRLNVKTIMIAVGVLANLL